MKYLTVNGIKILFSNEKNILEIMKKKCIDIPTLCYHKELSVYGACRLCIVEVEGRGILPACSTLPENAMQIRTNTERIKEIRKIIIELMLANHDRECPTCAKSETCSLQILSRRFGIDEIRFRNVTNKKSKDSSTYSLIVDPSKCVLCGSCVRFCDEIQGIGVLDFMNRGAQSKICPGGNNMNLLSSGCVYCGQCIRVCPTGAIVPKSEVNYVWKALSNPNKKVIVAIAPAVRTAIGEVFGLSDKNGTKIAGKIVSALRYIGFTKIFDISFFADMTIVEEANEFMDRLEKMKNIPMFTSCCPAWVIFVEKYYPDFIPNISSCRSPQGMYGSVVKKIMPKILGVSKENLVVVSIVPCTAKKFEARRHELSKEGIADIDYVLTVHELVRMIEESGLDFRKIDISSFDMPCGFKTGAGIIFGTSGGVTEAVLRNIMNNNGKCDKDVIDANKFTRFDFVRGDEGLRKVKVNLNGKDLNIAIVHGLKNASKILESIKSNDNEKDKYSFVEVMACPGGCVGGAGQPIYKNLNVRNARTKMLYENDRIIKFHNPQDNLYVSKIYKDHFGNPGSKQACEYLHTRYKYAKKFKKVFEIYRPLNDDYVKINICFGNNCIQKGAKDILKHIVKFIENNNYENNIGISISICLEKCSKGPIVTVAEEVIEFCNFELAEKTIIKKLRDKIRG
ncbi:MAG: [FeFe] hydrogenase, group A [Endomicrobium sp.]|jgi:NADH-quinone oxidoreductase subunit G|nr:[FeFe] hydrogenase, group A [Endomicrobium sp.]